jgi:hypothetical protein
MTAKHATFPKDKVDYGEDKPAQQIPAESTEQHSDNGWNGDSEEHSYEMKLVSPVETAFKVASDGAIPALGEGSPGAQNVRVSLFALFYCHCATTMSLFALS